MGKLHKRFNWKSRQIVKTVIDDSEQKKIKVEFDDDDDKHYDASNALVLPSAKRKTKKLKDKNAAPVKLLSKKQRLKLQKIAEKKLKNINRAALLEELQRVQAKPEELEGLIPYQAVQTLGRKKFLKALSVATSISEVRTYTPEEKTNLLKWKTPKAFKRELKARQPRPKRTMRDYNIVQTDSSSDSEDEGEDDARDANQSESRINKMQNEKSHGPDEQNDEDCETNLSYLPDDPSGEKTEEASNIKREKKKLKKERVMAEKNSENENMNCVKEINLKSKNEGTNSEMCEDKRKKRKLIDTNTNISDTNDSSIQEVISKNNKKNKLKHKDENIQVNEKKNAKKKKIKKNLKETNINNLNNESTTQKDTINKKKKKKMKNSDKESHSAINNIENENDSSNENCKEVLDTSSEVVLDTSSENKLNPNQNIGPSETLMNNTPEQERVKPARTFKVVHRDPEIQKQRLKLPILSEEHAVMEAINENQITIIVGPTGSGKTTQVPQFLYEAGYTSLGLIGVTEPRRIAAISMADRVGYELNMSSSKVSYQIRYEGNTTPETEIKFMTDGVLFQEIRNNHYLNDYSAIIIDEVHERSVHSDILLGLLSRIVPKRHEKGHPLKLIIMSATPRIEDFTQNANLFKNGVPPVIQIPSRLYSVAAHFNKHTNPDYCDASYKMVCRIHTQQPDGGILVFLTGQQEIKEMCQKLRNSFPFRKKEKGKSDEEEKEVSRKEKKERRTKRRRSKQLNENKILPEVNLKDFARKENESKNEKDDPISDEVIFGEEISEGLFNSSGQPLDPLWVLPLYSLLPSHKQKRVFEPPPDGTRLCVVATNVAETSLTIPNIKYIVDSGKTKEKFYDSVTGISSFRVTWTSQASATQRAGRAGRTTNGICYRLYSSAVYNDEFQKYSIPDIQRRPLDDVVLTMKALKVPVYTFPYPTPPDNQLIKHLSESFKRLIILGALEEDQKLVKLKKKSCTQMDTTVITKSGKSMSYLPMAPRFAKMVLNCNQHPEIYPYVVILIATLSVREIMVEIPLQSKDDDHDSTYENWRAKRVKWAGTGQAHFLGDLLVLINAVLEAEENDFSYHWCYQHGLRHSAVLEYRKLRRQLANEINLLLDDANLIIDPDLKPPTDHQAYLLAEVIFLGSKDQIARKVDPKELHTESDRKTWKNAYRALTSDDPVYLSSASVLYEEKPKYIMYQQIYESTKVYLRDVTIINEAWMMRHGGVLVDLSSPLDIPQPRFDCNTDRVVCHRNGTYGPNRWPLLPYEMEFPTSVELFKWAAYFFLTGDMWLPLKCFAKYLHDPKTLISPITLRYREKRQNLIRAMSSRSINSSKSLQDVWQTEPDFLKREYFAWFENVEKLEMLNSIWPPVKKEDFMFIYDRPPK